jgi:two-component system, cell cycle sensor histidine kinase and response regulator CckA
MKTTLSIEKSVRAATEATVHVLLLEDSLQDSQRILEELRGSGMAIEPMVVATRHEFLEAITSQDFSIILSAYRLRDWSGLEALNALKKAGKTTPFILVSAVMGESEATACLQHGVTEYVFKNQLVRLPATIRRALESKRLQKSNADMREALNESEARNSELIEQSVYGVFRVTLGGSFLYANDSLLKILGCPSLAALQTMNFSNDVFRFPEHYAKLLTLCKEGTPGSTVETEWRRKDGGVVSVKLHGRHVHKSGMSDEIEGIVEDVTDLRSLEHQLIHTQKFESIGQLAGGVAHDFNNVLGAILGWAEMGYEESISTPRVAERFLRIREQADRAASLTRELLAFARCQELQPRPVDLNSLLQNLTRFLDKVIGRDIEMKVKPGVLRPVQADPVQIEQVLMNICLNARDAMPEGGKLTIETEMEKVDETFRQHTPQATPGWYGVIAVTDTGIGMSQEIRDRIFEPFFTTKARGTGSGMGLATAYGIVKQHGGFISVFSEPWQGSLFRVYLPVSDGGDAEIPEKFKIAQMPRPAKLTGTETILLAEDHDSVREMARQGLTHLGYRVLSATNGEDALHLCEHEIPSLAILDVVMPRMGGAATAKQLRNRFPGLPIVFTSGYAESKSGNTSAIDNSNYLQKPYSPTSLSRMIRKVLDPAGSAELL